MKSYSIPIALATPKGYPQMLQLFLKNNFSSNCQNNHIAVIGMNKHTLVLLADMIQVQKQTGISFFMVARCNLRNIHHTIRYNIACVQVSCNELFALKNLWLKLFSNVIT